MTLRLQRMPTLSWCLAILMSVCTLLIPLQQGIAQTAQVSQAVANVSENSMRTLVQAVSIGQATAAQYSSAATALQSMFANWDEVGYTAQLQQQLLQNYHHYATPSSQTLTNILMQIHQAGGTNVTAGMLTPVYQAAAPVWGPPGFQEPVDQMISWVQTNGLTALHAQIVSALNQEAAWARISHQGAGLKTVQSSNFCAILIIIAVYLAVLTILLELGILTAPLGIIFAILTFITVALGFFVCL